MVSVAAAWIAASLISGSLLALAVAYVLWNRRRISGALPAAAIIFFAGIWTFSIAGNELSETLEAKLAWGHVSIISTLYIPVSWLLLSFSLANPALLRKRWLLVIILGVPAVTGVMEFTNSFHHLVWTDVRTDEEYGLNSLVYSRGPWFTFKIAHSYIFLIGGTVLAVRHLIRSPNSERSQIKFMLVAGAVPFLLNVLFVFDMPLFKVKDPTPFALIFSGIVVMYGLTRNSMFDVVSAARDTLSERISDAVVVTDAARRIIELNSAAVALLNAERESIRGIHICDILGGKHPQDACSLGDTPDFMPFTEPGTGSHKFLEIRSSRVERHSPLDRSGYLFVIRDVTGLVSIENELVYGKALLEELTEAAPDGILVVAENGEWLSANRRFGEIWNIDKTEGIGSEDGMRRMRLLIKDPESFEKRISEIDSRTDISVRDRVNLTNDRIIERFTSAIVAADGTRYGRVWFFRDITETEMARDHASRLGRLTTINAISRAVSSAGTPGEITMLTLERLCEHLDAKWGMYITENPSDDEQKRTVMARYSRQYSQQPLADGGSGPLDDIPEGCLAELTGAAGVSWCEHQHVVSVALESEQQLIGRLIIGSGESGSMAGTDPELLIAVASQTALALTRAETLESLKETNHELSEARQLARRQERLSALGEMASGIAHDINNSLSPVVGFSEMLLNRKDTLDARTQKFVSIIRTAALDVTHIVERMREFYRERSGDSELEAVSIKPLINEVILLTSPRWKNIAQQEGREIKISTSIATGVPPVPGIPHEIREALTNLIINATDALPNGGHIKIVARPLYPENADPDLADPTRLLLEIIDDGTGMDEPTTLKAIQPFFSTKGDQGTGLGLAMVYGMMRRHNGGVDIESRSGEGTTIRLTFPVADTVLRTAAPVKAPGPRPSLRILAVDDEPALRDLMEEMLSAEGHRVRTAPSGPDAVHDFEKALSSDEFFHIVITDLGMPGMDGRELASKIKELSPGTPVIILSGWGNHDGSIVTLPDGADALLSKPPRISQLRGQIDKLLSLDDTKAA